MTVVSMTHSYPSVRNSEINISDEENNDKYRLWVLRFVGIKKKLLLQNLQKIESILFGVMITLSIVGIPRTIYKTYKLFITEREKQRKDEIWLRKSISNKKLFEMPPGIGFY